MIRTEKLTVSYGGNAAIQNVSMNIPNGEITAIIGPSGCGKSSFLSSLNRLTDLIPNAQVTGDVFFDCCNVSESSPVRLRKCVGMIFQKPNPFSMSIKKNIQLGLREHAMASRKELDSITQKVLEDVGLWEEVKDRLNQSALELSGGQQQRLCIARALALRPQVLLMDEPCSALDPIAAMKVEGLIKDLRGAYTIVVVTHNLAQAKRISDHVALFWNQNGVGELIEFSPANELFQNPKHAVTKQYLSGASG